MANENDGRPLHPLPDKHPGDGGEAQGFTGYGDLPGKRAERIPGGAGNTGVGADRVEQQKRLLEEQGRTDQAAQRRGIRPRR